MHTLRPRSLRRDHIPLVAAVIATLAALGPATHGQVILNNGNLSITIRGDNGAIDTAAFGGADFFNPGTPVSNWGLQANTDTLSFQLNTTTGATNFPVSVSGGGGSATVTGAFTAGGANLSLTRTYFILPTTNVIRVTTTLTNNLPSSFTYSIFDTFDPDQDSPSTSFTYMDVYSLGGGIIAGRGSSSTTHVSGGAAGLSFVAASRDAGITVASGGPFAIGSGSDLNSFFTSPVDGNGVFTDNGVHIGKRATLTPGESTTVVTAFAFGSTPTAADTAAIAAFSTGWNNASGGNWAAAANWNPAFVPISVDDANFALASTYTVGFTANAAASNVAVTAGDVTFDLNGNSLDAGSFRVSRPGSNTTLRLTDGTFNVSATTTQYVGFGADKGTLYVDGATLNMLSSSRLTVADADYGQLNVMSGGKVNIGGNLFGGDGNNATASLTISGPGSEVNAGGLSLSTQTGDAGTLTISNGGRLSVSASANLTNGDATSSSQVFVTGANSSLSAATLSLGGTPAGNTAGAASLTISSGGAVTVTGTTNIWNDSSKIILSSGTLSTGTLNTGNSLGRFYTNWTGGTLELTSSGLTVASSQTLGSSLSLSGTKALVASGDVYVGSTAAGSLTVSGGTLESRSPAGGLVIGRSGAVGTAQISSGLIKTTYDLDIGHSTGTLTQTGGSISIGHTLNVGNLSGSGTGLLSGGSMTAGNILVGASSSAGYLGISGTASVSVSGTTTVNASDTMVVSGGWLATHDLNFTSAGSFSFTGGTITVSGGELKPRSGQVFDVSGPGAPVLILENGGTATASTGDWRAGANSVGTIKILGGSTVNLTNSQNMAVGFNSGSTGTLEVTGSGSKFATNGGLWVGQVGTGTVVIGSGGLVSAGFSEFGVSGSSGASGTVNVQSGGSLSISGYTALGGNGGAGRLFITGGTAAMDGNLYVDSGVSSISLSSGTLAVGGLFDLGGTSAKLAWTGGTIRLNGTTNSGDGVLTVPSGGTLGGSGNISRPTSVSAGGTIAPGNSPGTMTFSANLTLSTDSNLVMEIGAPTAGTGYDQIIMTSGATLAANGAQLKLIAMPGITTGVPYTLIDASAGNLTGTFKYLSADLLQGGPYSEPNVTFTINYTSNLVQVTFSAVPEPGGIMALFAAATLLQRRRRRWDSQPPEPPRN